MYDRSNSKNVYLRVAVNAIKKLRDEITNKSQGSYTNTSFFHLYLFTNIYNLKYILHVNTFMVPSNLQEMITVMFLMKTM